MKHLKRLNESYLSTHKMIILDDLIYEYLSYLKDAGYSIKLKDGSFSKTLILVSFKNTQFNTEAFHWEDIKYDLIPFLEVLPKHFDIGKIVLQSMDYKRYEYSLNDLVDDKKELTDKDLRYILIHI